MSKHVWVVEIKLKNGRYTPMAFCHPDRPDAERHMNGLSHELPKEIFRVAKYVRARWSRPSKPTREGK